MTFSSSRPPITPGTNDWLGLLGPLLSHGVLLEDEQRVVVFANEAFARLLGITIPTKTLEGMNCLMLAELAKGEFSNPEQFVADLDEQVRLRSEVRGHELELKDGRKYLLHYKFVTLPGGGGGHLWEFEEVTPQRVTEAKLLESELRLRHIINSAQDGIICLDSQGRVIEWNPEAMRLFGWCKAEAMGRPLTELFIPSEHHEAHRRGLARFLATGESGILQRRRVESIAVRKDGSRLPVELSISVIRAGSNVHFNAFVRDISAQKSAEETLKSEVRFRSFLAQLAMAMSQPGTFREIFTATLQSIQVAQPGTVAGLYRFKPEVQYLIFEAGAATAGVADLPERIHAKDAPGVLAELVQDWAPAAQYPDRRCYALCSDGFSVGYLVVCAADKCLTWNDAQFQAICASLCLGVKRHLDLLQMRILGAAIDAAMEGIAIVDTDGRYLYMNPAHAHLFGYASPSELLGKTWQTLYRPQVAQEFERNVFPKLAQDGYWHGFPTGMKKDGTDIPQVVSLTILPEGRIICVCMDNSERLNALESLQLANAALQQAARFKDEVFANMSHELRTPLNSIIGMTESLQMQVYGELAPRHHRPVETILSSARHLLDLINDVLDLAKIEAGKIELKKHVFDLAKMVESVRVMIREAAANKQLRLIFKIPENLPLLSTDERRLKQILVNLLDNAVKFTPEGRAVGLEVQRTETPAQILITVWDEGIGIPPDEQERLFHPFVQLDTGLARRYEGTGLGLALVQRLSQLLGGEVKLESRSGFGSRFTVVLPDLKLNPMFPDVFAISTLEDTSHEAIRPVPIRRDRNPLLLLVEDNLPNAEMLKTFLLAVGYRVIHAESGADALAFASKECPDAILMDIQMPKMDGWETIRRLKSVPLTSAIPVLAVTALAMPEDKARCLAAGVDDYFPKPLKLRELAAALEKLVPKRTIKP